MPSWVPHFWPILPEVGLSCDGHLKPLLYQTGPIHTPLIFECKDSGEGGQTPEGVYVYVMS